MFSERYLSKLRIDLNEKSLDEYPYHLPIQLTV